MKSQRHKKIRNNYLFYAMNFDFKEPQKILIDGNFLKTSCDIQYSVLQRLNSIFDIKVYLNITPCIIRELELFGPSFASVLELARKVRLYQCAHARCPINATDCIKSLIEDSNPRRFVVATQDAEIHELAKRVVPLPVLHFKNGNILKMIDVSNDAKEEAARLEREKNRTSRHELDEVRKIRAEEAERRRKIEKEKLKRDRERLSIKVEAKAKGPNPLSCKSKRRFPMERPHKFSEPN